MKLKLFLLLKNASKWVFKYLEKSGNAISDAEERMWFGEKNESNKK